MRRVAILLCGLLCLGAPARGADCVEPARGAGEIRAALARADLSPEERALVEERFAPDFAEAARLGIAADALFGFARCELNGAAPPELVAVGRSPAHCTGIDRGREPVCGVWALTATGEGWVQVLETAGTPRLSNSTTRGWRDMVLERGRAPAVYKFGGAAYQEDIGAAAPAEALEDYGGYGEGPDQIAWFAYDDPMPREVEAAFEWFYAQEIMAASAGIGALPDAFRVGLAELDRAAPEEAVIQGVTRAYCGAEGCRHWILSDLDAARPRILGRLRGFDLRVAASGGAGGRDLVAQGPDGLQVWRNEGDGWTLPGAAR